MTSDHPVEFVDRASRKRRVIGVLLAVDALMLLLATTLASYLRFHSIAAGVGFENISTRFTYYQVSWMVTALWLVVLWADGMYDLERLTWGAGEFTRAARAIGVGVVAFILITYVLKTPGLSRAWTLLAFAFAVAFVSLGRLGVRGWLRSQRVRGRLQRPTLVLGNNAEALSILRTLEHSPGEGLTPVGVLASTRSDELALDYCEDLAPVLGYAREVADVVRERGIDTVIIAGSAFDHEVISRMIAELRGVDVSIHVSSGLFEILTSRVLVRDVAGVPLITVKGVSLSSANLRIKRVFDVLVATAIVVVGMPLWIAIAIAIRVDSRGPVFYRQERVGQHGADFYMYKFRSMVADAETRIAELSNTNEATGPLFKMKRDPRVTRVGSWMRKFSIDEFPQLLNVLHGEMSLVGPRPPLQREVTHYTEHDWRRLEVPPGMTGLWQVSGRSSLTFDEMVRLDLYYIENWSVGFDIALIMRTVPAVLFARGAY